MCSPTSAFTLVTGVLSNEIERKQNKKTAQYRAQIAINNAKTAQNEALRQQQLGIDKAREEKIEGIRNANRQFAKNSANGLDATSQTSMLNYQDTITEANSSAQTIKQNYNLQADTYFERANSYLEDAQNYRNSYNNSLFSYTLNSLGSFRSVANEWYER